MADVFAQRKDRDGAFLMKSLMSAHFALVLPHPEEVSMKLITDSDRSCPDRSAGRPLAFPRKPKLKDIRVIKNIACFTGASPRRLEHSSYRPAPATCRRLYVQGRKSPSGRTRGGTITPFAFPDRIA